MPAKSGKQYRLMAAVAHGGFKSTGGLTPEVAKEFVDKTPPRMRSKWSKKKKN